MAIFTDPMHLTADGTFEIPINKIPWWRDPITISGFHTQIDGTGVSGDFASPLPAISTLRSGPNEPKPM